MWLKRSLVLVVLPTIVILHFVTTFQIKQEKFAVKALNASWMMVDYSNFTDNTFSMRMQLLRTMYQYQLQIRSYQHIGRQMKPSPFKWNIDMCQLYLNPLKYNFVIGSFYKSMASGNRNTLAKKCPIPANFSYSVDKYELKAEFFPKFFPPGRFVFNVTALTGKIKVVRFVWIWEISHHSLNSTYWNRNNIHVIVK